MSDTEIMLGQKDIQAMNDLGSINMELQGLYKQLKDHQRALGEISDLRKQYKAQRMQSMYQLVGGNLLREMPKDEIISTLSDRYKQVETAIESIKDQIKHREDNIRENYIRLYRAFKKKIPEDILKEIE